MTVLASVDDYLQEAAGLDKALLPLGFLLAFCAQHRLLSHEFMQQRAEELSSVRLQEGRVTALFAVHGGTLYEADFNSQGLNFLRKYLPQLADDFVQTFGSDCYEISDNWVNYQQLANVMIRQLLGRPKGASSPGLDAKSLWRTIKGKVGSLWK